MSMNGNTKWIAIILAILGSIVTIVLGYGRLGHSVEDNTKFRVGPGAKNTEHRIRDDAEKPFIREDLDEIKAFTRIQRQVNSAIMLKLQIEEPTE